MNTKRPSLNLGALLRLTAALIALLLLAGTMDTKAWFFSQYGLQTVTSVSRPTTLTIMGEHKTAITEIELSGVNLAETEEAERHVDFVFCVVSNSMSSYQIELAHTTNLPFTYSIYKATQKDSGTYEYNTTTDVLSPNMQENGGYINWNSTGGTSGGLKIADSTQHQNTYEDYNSVQQHAEPLYWLSESITTEATIDDDAEYVDYYVLRLVWPADVSNNKETDMVYLLAENA